MPGLSARHAVRSHTGLVREANEDDYIVLPAAGIYVVADGMGGHVAGKVASDLCVQTVEEYFANDDQRGTLLADADAAGLSPDALELAEALLLANRRIFDAASADRQLTGMGTTAVGIRMFGDQVAVSHAGDSRCYLYRTGKFQQVTVDHSLSNFLMALGRELEAQYAQQTMSNVIMRALGLEADVAVDTKEFPVRAGDRLLLCSDGLSDLVPDADMAQALANPALSMDQIVDRFVQQALDAGGRDNITVILVDLFDDGFDPNATTGGFGETLEIPLVVDGAEDEDDEN
jgi:protein phosphatase